MGGVLSYSIVSGMLLMAMYLAYRLLMARDNQHGFNRGILLLIYAVSFSVVPVILLFESLHPAAGALAIKEVEVENVAIAPISKPVWGSVLIWVFMAGMAAVAIKTIVTWVRLIRVINSGEKIAGDGYTIVVTDDERFAPLSWMRYVVIGRSDFETDRPVIVTHELKHINARHWIDLLIAQVVCIVNWFNPAAWLMRDELMLVHEYQADMAVIYCGHDAKGYQMLLIKKAVGARFPSLANSLNHSKLKKRITMMYKEKSGAGRRIKALALVPMLALALGAASVPPIRAAVSTISSSDVSVSKGNENLPQQETSAQRFKVKNFNNNGNETTIVVQGENLGNHLTVSGGTFTTNGKTYQAKSMRCDMTDGNAVIVIVFPFTDEYDNSSMTFTVNGNDVEIDLDSFFVGAQ